MTEPQFTSKLFDQADKVEVDGLIVPDINMDDLRDLPEMQISDDAQQGNDARASFAAEALVVFTDRIGDSGDIGTQIADLLANLRHLADAVGVDFYAADYTAARHYNAEIRGEF